MASLFDKYFCTSQLYLSVNRLNKKDPPPARKATCDENDGMEELIYQMEVLGGKGGRNVLMRLYHVPNEVSGCK